MDRTDLEGDSQFTREEAAKQGEGQLRQAKQDNGAGEYDSDSEDTTRPPRSDDSDA